MSYIGITLFRSYCGNSDAHPDRQEPCGDLQRNQSQRPVKFLDGIIKMWRKTYAAAQRANHIYLDKDVIQYLNEKCLTSQGSLQLLVNDFA